MKPVVTIGVNRNHSHGYRELRVECPGPPPESLVQALADNFFGHNSCSNQVLSDSLIFEQCLEYFVAGFLARRVPEPLITGVNPPP